MILFIQKKKKTKIKEIINKGRRRIFDNKLILFTK